jgi:flagellar biosynthetic protein FliS
MDIRRSYREATIRGARPVELVMRLYEQIVEDLRQAIRAIEQGDIELRTNRLNHAILVIAYLQSQLNLANDSKVSDHLNHFYDTLRQNLVQLQFHPSIPGVHQQITDLMDVREAWTEVERAERLVDTTGGDRIPKQTMAAAAGAEIILTTGMAPDAAREGWEG